MLYKNIFTQAISSDQIDNFIDNELEIDEKDITVEVIAKYNGDILSLEKKINAKIEILNKNYAIIEISPKYLSKLINYPEIEYVEKPKDLFLSVKNSLANSCISSLRNNSNYTLDGEGVIVAILDSGIDYMHPDFINEDGTSRILYIWDLSEDGKSPEGFKKGIEYSKQTIDEALKLEDPYSLVPQVDIIGHGTAVAGVACANGKSSQGRNVGVAPKSSIICVKLGKSKKGKISSKTTDVMRGISYSIDKAEKLNMPIAINISYGTNNGSHDGSSLFEAFIDDMSLEWKTSIVIASGNEGAASHHYSGNLENKTIENVDFYTKSGLTNFYITLWKNFVDVFSIELLLPNGNSTGEINFNNFTQIINFNNVSIFIRYDQPRHFNEDQEIFFKIDAISGTIPEGYWILKITPKNIVYGRFSIWLPMLEMVGENLAFTKPSLNTTLTLPSTAQNAICVGGYDDDFDIIASFSGRGFTRNDLMVKPDIVAPAVDILSVRKGGGYDAFTGTSMAAPFVTGSVCLMMQWGIVQKNDPFLYGQRIKAFLKIGAERNNNIKYPNSDWGYGTLCLEKTMEALSRYSKAIYSIQNDNLKIQAEDIPQINNDEKQDLSEFIRMEETASFLSTYNTAFKNYVKDKPYIKIGTILEGGYVVCYVSADKLETTIKELGEGYFNSFSYLLTTLDKKSLDLSGISKVHNQPYLNLKGKGVLMGFIDTGIDYTKENFIYENGESKIKFIWDQSVDGNFPQTAQFGSEFTNEQINYALAQKDPFSVVPQKDEDGHGTFLASVAASRETNDYIGAAPDADIIMVKLKKANKYYLDKFLPLDNQNNVFESADVVLGIKYLIDKAEELEQPIVICFALGSNFGVRDGSTILEEYITLLSNRTGIVFCTAAGNESNARHHTAGILKSTGNMETIGIEVGNNVNSFIVFIWNNSWDKISISVKSPAGEIINKIPSTIENKYIKELILEKSIVSTMFYQTSLYRLSSIQILSPSAGIWEIMISGEYIINGDFQAWLPITGLINPNVKFVTPLPNYTIVTPASSLGSITVGAYNGIDGSLYVSSSWGPTKLPRMSPDLVAPGVNVTGIYPTGFGTMTGTSIAAAITSGAIALLLQWGIVDKHDLDMNTDDVRTMLIRGCTRDPNTIYPNIQRGYGNLNLIDTFNLLRD